MRLAEIIGINPVKISGSMIRFDGHDIGVMMVHKKLHTNLAYVVRWAKLDMIDDASADGSSLERFIEKQVSGAKQFNFYQISNLKIFDKFQGLRLGHHALSTMLQGMKYPALVILHAKAQQDKRQPELLEFYKSLGFKFMTWHGHEIGVQFVP